MQRREISKALLASAAGSSLLAQRAEAQTCTAPCYARTQAEINAGVTPSNTTYFAEPWLWVRREGCALDGVTDDSAAFNRCLAVASTTNTALLIDGPLYLNSTISIPGNVQLVFVGNGGIKPGSGQTITLGQVPQAGLWQIFDVSATGSAVLMPPKLRAAEVWGEWWGANGEDTIMGNVNNEVPINAAFHSISNGGAGAGGTVRLGAGKFFISGVINIPSYCSLQGLNNWTLIRAQTGWNSLNGTTMISATNGTASMFDSRLEFLRINAGATPAIAYVVSSTGWQNRCGIYNCTIENFQQYGFYYTHGWGGAGVLEIAHVDFVPNDVSSAIGAYLINDGIVGWLKLNLTNVSFASGGTSATLGLLLDNRIICNVNGVDIETISYGIQLNGAATLTGSGLSAGGNPGITAIVHCGSSWTRPGYVNVSGVHIGGATAMLNDANRIYACAALEPWDGQLVWPPNLANPAGVCVITGAASPTLGNNTSFGVCSMTNGATISHVATGHQRLTYATSMDGTSTQFAVAQSMDVTAPIVSASPISATQLDIYTKTGAGAAADSGSIFLQIFHTP